MFLYHKLELITISINRGVSIMNHYSLNHPGFTAIALLGQIIHRRCQCSAPQDRFYKLVGSAELDPTR